MNSVTIIGAGLAGCESALQLSSYGYKVKLYDSKPKHLLPVYNLNTFAELVCNSSMGKTSTSTPLGQLLYELKLFKSKLVCIAENCRVEDEYNFAVDKKSFSKAVTDALISAGVTIYNEHLQFIPQDDVVIIATGPMTDEILVSELSKFCGIKEYYFADASSPIVDIESIDIKNRKIKKISDDLYCILLSDQFVKSFCKELTNTKCKIYNQVDEILDFEECQSIEKIARMGTENLIKMRLSNEYENQPSLLLRRENGFENGYILVGCMTTLSHTEQQRVFSMIPGFENVQFVKYGRMHRNTYLYSPGILNSFYQIIGSNIYIVGQLSGVDGYAPSIASGLVAATKIICGNLLPAFPTNTMIGGLAKYVSNVDVFDFQPMCASYALIEGVSKNFFEASQKSIRCYQDTVDLLLS